ncbi:S-adenosyl-L-methionine-dependent methyltransferase [Trematosphaeria pertusa]|uniref:S-adenosyl-L-methionine-dependent methyltransferase n=1 Tax=Trematosphaeria pertusa TaxID=390896 RepID=A0A6A6I1B9_9PLEO|nr:S-adenosyl-L-methionine-dependent methyltransferase [Trematosphaeria pertusa]KAF2243808.1 S-adenosyl-L-methionine-dependent methyltransferase [Trematosphaeria pertusa]
MTTPFKPKQCLTLSAAAMAEMQGDGSQQAIKYFLKLTPLLTSASIVHDNACGAGAVTELIMTSEPPPPSGLRIHATDINERFVADTKALVESKGWPVTAQVMNAKKLSFEDNYFSHSFTAFAFHCMPGAEHAAMELYRTLQPGGTAVAAIWTSLPFVTVFQQAHWATRGRQAPLPSLLQGVEDVNDQEFVKLLEAGGFKDVQTHEIVAKTRISTDLERWANLVWSYLGRRPREDEWTVEDEKKWEEAIKIAVEEMHKKGRMEVGEDGALYIRFVGCVAVMRK